MISYAEQSSFQLDTIENWIEKPTGKLDCELILDARNMFSDLLKASGDPFRSGSDDGITLDVCNKLFYRANLPVIRRDGEKHTPAWENKDLYALKAVLEEGLSVLKKLIMS